MARSSRPSTVLLAAMAAIVLTWIQARADPFGTSGWFPDWIRFVGSLLFVSCPIASALAAWRSSALVRSGLLALPGPRAPWRRLLRAGTPAALVGVAGAFGGAVLAQGVPISIGLDQTAGLVAVLAAITASSALGLSIGIAVRRWELAVPISVLATYVLIAFPPSFESPWPRHLTGQLEGCCAPSDFASWRVAAAVGMVAVGLLAMAPAVAAWRLGRLRLPVLAVGGVAGVVTVGVVAQMAVSPLGPFAAVPRPESQLACSRIDDDWELCLWPEQDEAMRPVAVEFVQLITERASVVGFEPQFRVSASPYSGVWFVTDALDPDRRAIFESLAAAFLPPPEDVLIGCPSTDVGAGAPGARVALLQAMNTWWWSWSSAGEFRLDEVDAEVNALVSEVESRPVEEQISWFVGATQAVTSCSMPMPS
jgi:hypothetical protein